MQLAFSRTIFTSINHSLVMIFDSFNIGNQSLTSIPVYFITNRILIITCLIICLSALNARATTARYRCMWRDNPATTMVVGWDQVTGTNPVFYYDVTDNGQKAEAYKLSKKPDLIVPARGMNNAFVRLSGLKPNTVYYFVIKDSEGVSKRFSFKTAPDRPERLSIIAGGDSRNHQKARVSANRLVSKLRPHVVLFNGDMTPDDSAGEWRKWLDDWQETFGSDGRIFPVLVARGNHEASNQSLIELFDVGSGGIFYAYNLGGNLLRIYTLNSLIPVTGTQLDWFEKDLQQNSNISWRMVQYHYAMRPHTKEKPEKDELVIHWAPLFYKYKVQLAIESDSHVAKWTYPLRPSNEPGSDEGFIQDDEKGTVYVGEGCWGAPLREANDDKSWTRNSGSFNSFNWIFVDADKMEIRTVMTDVSEGVGELKDNNLFTQPVGLSIWRPSNGDVVTIYKNPALAMAAAKPKVDNTKVMSAAPEKPGTTTPTTKSSGGTAAADNTEFSKLQCDAAGKVSFKYTLPRAGNVLILLLDEKYTVLDRQSLSSQTAKSYLREFDLSVQKKGIYHIIVKCGEDVIHKYQVNR
ncbi:MAG: fibronectin type III domain-containing protein [Saprospiraceae bacterium]